MEYDVTWRNPSVEQLAALEYACKALGTKPLKERGVITHHFMVKSEAIGRSLMVDSGVAYKSGMSEYDYAELILLAEHSLWYVECKNKADRWSACKFILDVVSLGYKDGKWWDLSRMDEQVVKDGVASLKILGLAIRNVGSPFTSQGFLPVIDLILGKNWLAKTRQQIREKLPYVATKCIKPDCENMVAPVGIKPQAGHFKNYMATGACVKGHNVFTCSKCNKPHSYTSGVGKEHIGFATQ
jgi:hypothetical protein